MHRVVFEEILSRHAAFRIEQLVIIHCLVRDIGPARSIAQRRYKLAHSSPNRFPLLRVAYIAWVLAVRRRPVDKVSTDESMEIMVVTADSLLGK